MTEDPTPHAEDPLADSGVPEIRGYRLLDVLGEGGMGTVYLGEQREPVQRRVALKVVKLGMDTKQVLARFEVERRALSLMEHGNVARVLDAGATADGRPFFAMEYVSGVPLTDYCDEHRLGLRERLSLFAQCCAGVQHAHNKGVLHRDLKPGNVLVTVQDRVPRVKIIDFGLARATDHRLVEHTLYTQQGQMIGTPEYMSPEQAGLGGLDVDTRTDVYSLGVILYELLTGTLPFDWGVLRKAGLLEMERRIREDEPPKPSSRLGALGEPSKEWARRRDTSPAMLRRELRGDLDWIVMKALEKDRTRRYDTADGLARDVERYLRHEPVEAGPPSSAYRLRKFVRRNRVGVAVTAVVLVALLAGITLASFGLMRARSEAESARRVAEFYERTFTSLVPFRMGQEVASNEPPGRAGFTELTVVDLLRGAAGDIERMLGSRPVLEGSVRRTFGWTFTGLGLGDEALHHLQRAVELQREALGENHPETLHTVSLLSFTQNLRGDLAAAVETIRSGATALTDVLGPEDPVTLEARRFLANMLWNRGELEEAEDIAAHTAEVARRALGADHGVTLWAEKTLGMVHHARGRLEEAESLLGRVEERAASCLANNPLRALAPLNRALALAELGRLRAAEERMEVATAWTARFLGDRHPFVPFIGCASAILCARSGDHSAAAAQLSAIEARQSEQLGTGHFMTLWTRVYRVGVLLDDGRSEDAALASKGLPAEAAAAFGRRGATWLQARHLRARALLQQGQGSEAVRRLEAVLRDAEALLPGGFLELPEIRRTFARALSAVNRVTEAEGQMERAYGELAETYGPDHARTRSCARELAALQSR